MKSRTDSGFTLIEVLVVLGIIVLLVGLLMPALAMARKTSNAAASQANLKQWGAATINYATINKDRMPWEGMSGSSNMESNLLETTFWANAVASLAGERPYSKFVDQGVVGVEGIPLPGSRSIFIDPGAEPDANAPWQFASGKTFYFNYVPNSRLNDAVATPIHARSEVISMHHIQDSAATVLMMEARSNTRELTSSDPYSGTALDLCHSDWHAFPTRHFEGGHVVFADGHVAHITNDLATSSVQASRDPNQPLGDWNKPKLIWNPMGPAGNIEP